MIKYLKALTCGMLLAGLVAISPVPMQAQTGPYSAQITSALRAFLTQAHTWTGVQTFSGGASYSGQVLLANGTAPLPSLAFTGATNLGIYKAGTNQIGFATLGSPTVGIDNGTGLRIGSGFGIGFTTGDITVSPDTLLVRHAAGAVASTTTALATTSTFGLGVRNTTLATGGATVQMSPAIFMRGNVWDTAASETLDAFEELLPVSAATPTGTIRWGVSLNGAAATYPMTLTSGGILTTLSSVISGGSIRTSNAGGGIGWSSAGQGDITSPANGQYNFNNNGASSGIGIDVTTDSTLKIRTRAQSGYATVDALGYLASGVAGVTGTCDTPTFTLGIVTTCGGAGNSVDGTYFVTGNFTTANNTNFQLITGLSWTFPATSAVNVPFRCSITYSQATAAVSDSLGVQAVTVAPTNAMFTGSAETALGTTAYGDLTAFSSTTATAVVTFTPSATATIFVAYIDGLIEHPSNASTSAFQIQIKTTTGADAITVYRGSFCKVG